MNGDVMPRTSWNASASANSCNGATASQVSTAPRPVGRRARRATSKNDGPSQKPNVHSDATRSHDASEHRGPRIARTFRGDCRSRLRDFGGRATQQVHVSVDKHDASAGADCPAECHTECPAVTHQVAHGLARYGHRACSPPARQAAEAPRSHTAARNAAPRRYPETAIAAAIAAARAGSRTTRRNGS